MDTKSTLSAVAQLLNANRSSEARRLAEVVARRDPANPLVHYLLGGVFKQEGNFQKAESCYLNSLKIAASQPQVRNSLGALYMMQERIKEAEIQFGEACRLKADYFEAWSNLGLVRLKLGAVQAAKDAYQAAVRLNSNSSKSLRGLARALISLKEFNDAEIYLAKAIKIAPKEAESYFYLGRCQFEMGKFQQASTSLMEAIKYMPQSAEIRYEAAKNALISGELEAAGELFRAALEITPEDLDLIKDYSRYLFFSSKGEANTQKDACFSPFEAAFAKGNDDPDLSVSFALEAYRVGASAKACDRLNWHVDRGQANEKVYSALSYLSAREGEADNALKWAAKAVEVNPNFKGAQQQMSVAAMLTDNLETALDAAKAACRLDPADQLSIAHFSTVLRLMGEEGANGLYDIDSVTQRIEIEPPEGFDSIHEFNAELVKFLNTHHGKAGEPLDQSLRGGTQVQLTQIANNSSIIAMLRAQLKQAVTEYAGRISYVDRHPVLGRSPSKVDLAGIWSVRLQAAGNHVSHVHPQGWISACYYVDLPDDVMDSDAHEGWLRLGAPPHEVLERQLAKHDIRPLSGTMIVFPSYMWHSTIPFNSSKARITTPVDVGTDVAAVTPF